MARTQTVINQAAAGTQVLSTPVAGKPSRLCVLAITFNDGAGTITFQDSDATLLSGAIYRAQYDGMHLLYNLRDPDSMLTTDVGKGLSFTTTTPVKGYAIVLQN